MVFSAFTTRYSSSRRGFTLIELLVVVAILGVLMAVVLTAINPAKIQDEARLAQSKEQLGTLARTLEVYMLYEGNVYPADVNRGILPGMEKYLKTGDWPNAPWPGSVYDWDNYVDTWTGGHVYQFSIRYCELNNPAKCNFPKADWAKDFDYHSSVYYCLSGPCKSHEEKPPSHPGYCVNCARPTPTI